MKAQIELERLVGRLLVGRVAGTSLDPEMRDCLERGVAGGVTLFKDNAGSLAGLVELVASVRGASFHPAIVAVDQEGGAVQRFDHVLTPLPSAMALSACSDLESLRLVTELSARQLRLVGINLVLAPVLDVLSHPLNPVICTRSFGSDPERVKQCGLVAARAYADGGLLCAGKHFPGHGDTVEDSHSLLAVNRTEATELWQRELVPFRACHDQLPAMLTAHVWLPCIDPEPLPASLSPRVTSGLLRQYLGYSGLVITDDLLMKAITDQWGPGEGAVRALEAGADLLLVCGSAGELRSVHQAVLEALAAGRLSEQRIKQSVNRVAQALGELPAGFVPDELPTDERISRLDKSLAEGRQSVLQSSIDAIAQIRGDVPALDGGNWKVLVPRHDRYPMNLVAHLRSTLDAGGMEARISEVRYPLDPSEADIASITAACREDNAILITYRLLLNTGQCKLGTALVEACREKVSVATDVPYDVIGLPLWDNCLATFDPSELAMEALARVLAGKAPAAGRSPVSLEFDSDFNP